MEAGKYKMIAKKSGYKKYTKNKIKLKTNHEVNKEIQLKGISKKKKK